MFQGWEMCLKSTLDTISGCKSFYSTSWCKSIERHNLKITLFTFSQYQNPHDRGLRVCGFGAHLDAGDQRQPHQDRRLLCLCRAQACQVSPPLLQCQTSARGEQANFEITRISSVIFKSWLNLDAGCIQWAGVGGAFEAGLPEPQQHRRSHFQGTSGNWFEVLTKTQQLLELLEYVFFRTAKSCR